MIAAAKARQAKSQGRSRKGQSGTNKRKLSSNDPMPKKSAAQGFNPTQTFQLISDIDAKLANKNGVFNEEAHEMKRRLLLQRAEEAKRRIEAQNFKKDQNAKTQ